MSIENLSQRTFNGWKGYMHYFKSKFSQSYRKNFVKNTRDERLKLYYALQKLIKQKCSTYGMRESKRLEFQMYFREAHTISDPQDITYFINTMYLVKEKLETGEFPPFPRRLPTLSPQQFSPRKDILFYRK